MGLVRLVCYDFDCYMVPTTHPVFCFAEDVPWVHKQFGGTLFCHSVCILPRIPLSSGVHENVNQLWLARVIRSSRQFQTSSLARTTAEFERFPRYQGMPPETFADFLVSSLFSPVGKKLFRRICLVDTHVNFGEVGFSLKGFLLHTNQSVFPSGSA